MTFLNISKLCFVVCTNPKINATHKHFSGTASSSDLLLKLYVSHRKEKVPQLRLRKEKGMLLAQKPSEGIPLCRLGSVIFQGNDFLLLKVKPEDWELAEIQAAGGSSPAHPPDLHWLAWSSRRDGGQCGPTSQAPKAHRASPWLPGGLH